MNNLTGGVSIRHGKASIHYGPKPYGQPRIVASAPATTQGFEDLIEAVTQAKNAYEEEL